MKTAPVATRNECHQEIAAESLSIAGQSVDTNPESRRAMQQYRVVLDKLTQTAPDLAAELPQMWPQEAPQIDQEKSLSVLRSVTSTLNEGLLIVGFGDGSILEHLRQDPIGRSKLITLLILEQEKDAFAHGLGVLDFQAAINELHLDIHYVRNPGDLTRIISGVFANHAQITRLAGTTIMDSHPLTLVAEKQREEWLPALRKIILERYDCLGNDVYDTFLGAKHALMHGKKIITQRRASDYINRYSGKTALCIASGPSVADYYDQIRAIQHEHIIICADSILGGLLEKGIEPDFVCMVERPDDMHLLIDEHAPKCKTVMVALPVVHPSSVAPFDDRVVWWWNADDLYPWIDPKEQLLNSGRSAGTITVALAALLGVKTAYLVGHDLAFKNGQSHGLGANALALQTQAKIKKELSRNNGNYYRRIIDAEKNGGGTLETMGVWDIFRSDLESIVYSHLSQTAFVNINIRMKVGAVISGTVEGALPEAAGTALEKSHPERIDKEEQWSRYRERCLQLRADFDLSKKLFLELSQELLHWRPLSHDRKAVEAMGERVDLTKMVSLENRPWFAYVFRAALRNLMVRLHHNTYVRTMAERNWNQVQVIRTYVESVPFLIDRLRPELETSLESFS